MARTIRNRKLDSRSARQGIPISKTVHWVTLGTGRSLGYRRGENRGTWVVKFRLDGNRREERLALADDGALPADGVKVLNFEQAQKAAWKWFDQITTEQTGEATTTGDYTVSAALDDYLAWMQREGKRSARITRYNVERHLRPELGTIRVDQLTARKIEQWRASIAATPRRTAARKKRTEPPPMTAEQQRSRRDTSNRVLTVLKAALNLSLNYNKTLANGHAWRTVKSYKGTTSSRVRFLSLDEQQALAAACEPDLRQLVRGALYTGCRLGELARVKVQDLNTEARTLYVSESKSGYPRQVYLNGEAVKFLTLLAAGRGSDALIFLRSNGEAWEKDAIKKPLRIACIEAKIPRCNFHTLRHSAASRWVTDGVPLKLVAEQLGHTSTRITERYYAHVGPTQMGQAFSNSPALGLDKQRLKAGVVEVNRGRKTKRA